MGICFRARKQNAEIQHTEILASCGKRIKRTIIDDNWMILFDCFCLQSSLVDRLP